MLVEPPAVMVGDPPETMVLLTMSACAAIGAPRTPMATTVVMASARVNRRAERERSTSDHRERAD